MTDEELKELVASLAIAQKKTDEQMRHTDEMLEHKLTVLSEKIERVGDLVGNMGRNQGDVAEEFFFNSLAEDAHLGTVHFDDITKNQHKQRGKFQEEYDIVMTNGEAVGIVEVKYKVHENDLKKLERKMRSGGFGVSYDHIIDGFIGNVVGSKCIGSGVNLVSQTSFA
jgi:hypothetical protein